VVDTDVDVVKVDGTQALPVEELVYVLLFKPADTMTTLHDPFKRGRRALSQKSPARVYPVGRLDYDAEACSFSPTTASWRSVCSSALPGAEITRRW